MLRGGFPESNFKTATQSFSLARLVECNQDQAVNVDAAALDAGCIDRGISEQSLNCLKHYAAIRQFLVHFIADLRRVLLGVIAHVGFPFS